MERKTIIGFAVVLPFLMNTACAVTIPVDANMRIDTKSGYQQRGIAVDRRDMMDKLEEEPENRETIQTARTLSTAGIALSSIGGAAMGWPLGQFMGGERHPSWWMAGVGGGLFLLGGLPLALASDAKVAKAVDLHNKLIDQRDTQTWKTPPKPKASVNEKALLPLPEGFGFEFDKGPEENGALCRALGNEWTEKDEVFFCSSVPSSEINNASAELTFAEGQATSLRIFVHPGDKSGSWIHAIAKVEAALGRTYGAPTERDFSVPSDCVGKAFTDCVTSGKVKGRASWSQTPERSVFMAIVNTPPEPMIVIQIKRVPATALQGG